jgi:hypothetical protein
MQPGSANCRWFSAEQPPIPVVTGLQSKKKSKGSALVVMADLNSAARAATATNGRASNPLLVVPFPKVAGVPPDGHAAPAAQPPPVARGGPGGSRPSLFPLGGSSGGAPRPAAGGTGSGPAAFSAGAAPLFPSGRPASFPDGGPSSFPPAAPSSFPTGSPGSFPGAVPSSVPAASPASFPGGAPSTFPSASRGRAAGSVGSERPPAGFPDGGASSFPAGRQTGFPGAGTTAFPASPALSFPGAGAFGGLGEQADGDRMGRDFEHVSVSRMRQREERERLIAEMKAQDARN